MIVIFAHELKIDNYKTIDEISQVISSFPTMPNSIMDSIEDFQMFSDEILQGLMLGKGYGNIYSRIIYFAWEIPWPPSIGWTFRCPFDLDFDSPNTITDIFFGAGDALLCEYE